MTARHFATLICAVALAAFTGRAQAQSMIRDQDYMRDVIALADTLGRAHGIRVLCNGNADQYWRRHMVRLLDMEAPSPGGLRQSMIDGFNSGFAYAGRMHRQCNSAATGAEQDYAATGEAITNRLATANIPGARLGAPDP
ncbi:MAG: TIGR02301 family protein [Pseudomonadota bacterium]